MWAEDRGCYNKLGRPPNCDLRTLRASTNMWAEDRGCYNKLGRPPNCDLRTLLASTNMWAEDRGCYNKLGRPPNCDLRTLRASTNVIIVIKSKWLRWMEPQQAWQTKHSCSTLAVNPEEKRPVRRPSRRQEDIIKCQKNRQVWNGD